MLIQRLIRPNLLANLGVSPIVFLNGGRQSGKSTLVLHTLDKIGRDGKEATYITFDNVTQMAAASASPDAFLAAFKPPLVLDEIQLVPELFRTLKVAVDEVRRDKKSEANGRYLLTGSANILAFPQLADALVGRMNVLTLYPLCTAEAIGGLGNGLERIFQMDFAGMKDRSLSLVEAIKVATFPEIYNKSDIEANIWFEGYLSTILQRDVRQLAELEKITVLPTLLRILATRAGNLINDAELAREVGLNAVTGKFYRNILKMMFLTMDIAPWYRNIGKRLVKSSKGYLCDTLFLCFMLGYKLESTVLYRTELFGHILENYVAMELTKLLSFMADRAKLYHFRTSDGKEIDFIIEKADGSLWAIEVKSADNVSEKDFNSIKLFSQLTGKEFQGGIILYSGKEAIPFGQNLWAVPYCVLWQ